MKRKAFYLLPIVALLGLFAAAYADHNDKLAPYRLLTTISIPGGLVGFDISWVDSERGRYYLADRGTAATPPTPGVDVIDTKHNKFLYKIPLTSGTNGVVAIGNPGDDDDRDRPGVLVVGMTASQAQFIDLANPLAAPVVVSTNGNHRADEMAYDPRDHIILIANDQDTPAPFVSFISTVTHAVLGKIVYDGNSGNPRSTGGIEQSVWNARTGRFYISIPATAGNPTGEIDEINPVTMAITKIMPTSAACGARGGPAGLALIPGQHLIASCGDVLDIASGSVLNVSGVSGDEIWFSRGDDRVYFGGGLDRISVNVVNGLNPYDLVTTLTVGSIATPPAPNHTTHSVAADSQLNRIFVPVSYEGVKVYTDDQDNGQGPDN